MYNYYRDELTNDGNDNFANRNVVNSEAFKYKNKITGNTYNVNSTSQQTGVNLDGGNTAAPKGATFAINDCKLYVPAVTLSKDDEIKLLTNLKSGFKREIIWNKYRSQMTTEAVNNNLNILIDPSLLMLIDCLFWHTKMLMIDNHFLNFICQMLW